jgi:hypothetical protein
MNNVTKSFFFSVAIMMWCLIGALFITYFTSKSIGFQTLNLIVNLWYVWLGIVFILWPIMHRIVYKKRTLNHYCIL